MPAISMFYGIIIYLYFKDNKKHNTPHIHAEYGEFEGVFDIITCGLIAGDLPKAKIPLVRGMDADPQR